MADLKLHKPLCFFDLETTGVNVGKDRIVEICVLRVMPDASEKTKTWLVNPGVPIPKEASEVHGITDEDVADCPSFGEIAPEVIEMLKDADLAGFNSNRFDVPLLAEELLRSGFDFDLKNHRLVDVQVIFHKMEPRNLSAAYRFYCEKELVNAHSAEADVRATYEVLRSQVERYEAIGESVPELSEFSHHKRSADLAGFIGYNKNGEEIFNFGKYKNKKVAEVFISDPGYYGWIQNADFPLYTKKVLTGIKLKNGF